VTIIFVESIQQTVTISAIQQNAMDALSMRSQHNGKCHVTTITVFNRRSHTTNSVDLTQKKVVVAFGRRKVFN